MKGLKTLCLVGIQSKVSLFFRQRRKTKWRERERKLFTWEFRWFTGSTKYPPTFSKQKSLLFCECLHVYTHIHICYFQPTSGHYGHSKYNTFKLLNKKKFRMSLSFAHWTRRKPSLAVTLLNRRTLHKTHKMSHKSRGSLSLQNFIAISPKILLISTDLKSWLCEKQWKKLATLLRDL